MALFASGLLAYFADFPHPVPVLAWLAPVPVMVLALRYRERNRELNAGWIGLLFGLAVSAGNFLPKLAFFPILPRLCLYGYCALVTGLAFSLALWLARRLSLALFGWLFAAAVVVSGLSQQWHLNLGSWMPLAYTQVEVRWLRSVATLGGTPLVCFLVSLGGGALASLMAGRDRATWVSAGVAFALIGAAAVWGTSKGAPVERKIRVATISVRPPAEIRTRWWRLREVRTGDTWAVVSKYKQLTRKAAVRGARIVGWPEAGLLLAGKDQARLVEELRALARETGAAILAGYVDIDARRNQALLVGPSGTLDLYSKQHLVPGIETSWLEGGDRPFGGIVLKDLDLKVAVVICYDADFPGNMRAAARWGADLIVVPSSDPLSVVQSHAMQAVMHAAENRLAMMRPANPGLSVLSDPSGRIVGQGLRIGADPVLLVGELPITRAGTVFSVAGNWMEVLSGAALILALFLVLWRRPGAARR